MIPDQINQPESPPEEPQPENNNELTVEPAAPLEAPVADPTVVDQESPTEAEAAAPSDQTAQPAEDVSVEAAAELPSTTASPKPAGHETEAAAAEMVVEKPASIVPPETLGNDAVTTAQERSAQPETAEPAKKERKAPSKRDIRRVTEAFVACVRCGYFLSDYRMLFGEEHFGEMVGERHEDWVVMRWSHEMRRTLEKCFGINLHEDIDYYQGCCEMCRRNFVVETDEADDKRLRVQVRMPAPQPRRRR